MRLYALLLSLLLACSPSTQQKALTDSYAAVQTAQKAWSAFAPGYEQSLVANAATKPDADAKLAAFRANRTKVETAIVAAYQAVALAATATNQPNARFDPLTGKARDAREAKETLRKRPYYASLRSMGTDARHFLFEYPDPVVTPTRPTISEILAPLEPYRAPATTGTNASNKDGKK